MLTATLLAVQRRALAEAAAMARGAAVRGDDVDSDDDDDDLYAGVHSGVLLEGFEHLDVDEIMVRRHMFGSRRQCAAALHTNANDIHLHS